ncbi:BppU family phage baseplate upper protein [Carnobacterium maltaromaticum]|uniref:BppU family phage baseplate upper protein n=1 Tax=Carnobacterium maltaromaticum TaxID=2751 RepID=UPI0039BDFA09
MIRYPFELSTTQQNHVGWLNVRQNDTGTQQFVATITTNDITQDLTGMTAEFRTRQNNENVIIEKASITNAKDGVVEYVVSQYAMQQLGKNIGYFTFSKDDVEMFSTKDFCYYVNTSVTTFGLKGCDYIWRIEDLIEYVKDLANQAETELNKVSSDVEVMQKQIDDMFALIASQGVLSANDVKKLMVKFMSGEDIKITDTFDFTGKIIGSVIENPNIARRFVGSAIPTSPPSSNEYTTQAAYDAIKKLEGTLSTQSTNVGVNGSVPWHVLSFAVVENYKRKYPFIFKGSDAENLALLKSKLIEIEPLAYAKGSGPSGNKISAQVYFEGNWIGNSTNTTANISQIGFNQLNPDIAKRYIGPDGFCHLVVFSEASNSATSSIASVDYASIKGTTTWNIRDFIPTPRVLNAKDYGIKGDGITNDTAAIQALINRMGIGDTLYFFPGTFMIDATAAKKLIWKSNINIEINPQATLKVISNNAGNYELFDLSSLSNIRIYGGGRLLGDRSNHTGTTGEWGMGIMMKKSTNIKIEDIQIDDFWGDGIYVGGDGYGNQSKNIIIRKVTCDNNRRQGISVVNIDDLLVESCTLMNTNGTAPQTGIDFEPNNNGEMLKNIVVRGTKIINNAGGDILFAHGALAREQVNKYLLDDNQISITLSDIYSQGNFRGPYFVSDSDTKLALKGFIQMNNITIVEPTTRGFWMNNWRESHMAKVRVNNLSITDSNANGLSTGSDTAGVLLSSGGTSDGATDANRISYSGVTINNLSIIDTRAVKKILVGIKTVSDNFQLQNAKITNYDTNLHESTRLAWIRGEGTIKYVDDRGYKITSGTQSAETTQYFGQTLMTQNGNSYLMPHSREHIGKEISFRVPLSGAIRFPTIRLTNANDSFVGCGVLAKTVTGMVLRGKTGNEIRFKAVEDDQWLITYLGEPGTFT